jgi:hypothetical protein
MTTETKAEAFVRLANKRVPKALTAIRVISNLANYPGTVAQKNKIVATLRTAVEDLEYKFAGSKEDATPAGFDVNEE